MPNSLGIRFNCDSYWVYVTIIYNIKSLADPELGRGAPAEIRPWLADTVNSFALKNSHM